MDADFEEKPVVLGPFRGAVASACLDRAILQALAEPDRLMESGKAFHSGRNRLASVTLADSSGRRTEAVIKQFRLRGVDRLKSALFPSKANGAWRGAIWLLRRNIPTPRPLAFLERRIRGLTAEGYYLAEKLDNIQEVRRVFRSLGGEEMEKLLRALAVFLRNCHGQGILHKDLSDGNILAAADDRGDTVFYLLDTNRVRAKKKVGLLAAAGNLVRLGIPPQFQPSFLSYYWQGRPVPSRFLVWYRFRKKWYTGMVNLKKRLGLRKLARKLGVQ